MPLDPSIISSYNPGAGIDVNALMQQRMQGMANINALERQRQADALDMQDRAAAQKKAQEDATVKALLPAYAYGFQNPSDPDGILALAPADQQEALAPYIDQIRDKPPEQVIAALTGSLVTSEVGRAFLENQARQRTYQVQLQQAETAAAREAREAAAVGVPKPMSAYEAERVKLDREKFDAEQKKAARIASGEEAPVQLSKDQIWDPVTKRAKAAEGTELYRKQKAEHVKDYKEAETTLQRLDNVAANAQELKDTTGWQKAFGTGAIMSRMPNTPASSFTGAYDFQTKYDNLAGSVKEFGRAVAQMQGKLGNMAVQEWKAVADSVAALDLSKMSGSELDNQLDKIATQIEAARNNVRRAYELEYGESQYYEPLSERGTVGPPEEGGAARPAGVGQDWSLEQDAQGNKAWVSPDRKRFIEVE
jgi:ribosomal protein S16